MARTVKPSTQIKHIMEEQIIAKYEEAARTSAYPVEGTLPNGATFKIKAHSMLVRGWVEYTAADGVTWVANISRDSTKASVPKKAHVFTL